MSHDDALDVLQPFSLRKEHELLESQASTLCSRSFRGLRAGDDCPTEGCAGRVYFEVPAEEVQHV